MEIPGDVGSHLFPRLLSRTAASTEISFSPPKTPLDSVISNGDNLSRVAKHELIMLRSKLWMALVLALACANNASADIWHSGDLTTYTQSSWGGDPGIDGGAALLVGSYDTVYAGSFGLVTVGSSSGFTMTFTDADSVRAYLPSIGFFAPLNGSVANPIATASGAFGGEVLALELNVDFSDAGFLPGGSGLRFGDLILANFSPAFSPFNGLTVRQFLGDTETLLGGGATIFTIADLDGTVGALNASFSDGAPTAFAQAHLVAPTSASPVPEPSSRLLMITAILGLGRYRKFLSRRAESGN